MKRKILYTAIVAAVMGSFNPAHAQSPQPIYGYLYFDANGHVGQAVDRCTTSGVITHGQWLWGYATSNVEVVHQADCLDGQWVPIS